MERFDTRLVGVNYDGSDLQRMMRPKEQRGNAQVYSPGKASGEELAPDRQDNVIHWLPDDPHNVLVSVAYEQFNTPSVYRLNITKDKRTRIVKPLVNVRNWVADYEQQQFIGIGFLRTRRTVYLKDIKENEVRTLWDYDLLDESGPYPLGFDKNPRLLYVSAPYQGREAIYTVDLKDKDLAMKLVASDEQYDIDGYLIQSPKTGNYVGVYFDGESGRNLYWDEEYKALQTGIDKAMPDGRNEIVNLSRDEKRYILYHSGPNTPAHYLLGDRVRKSLDSVGGMYPELETVVLPQKKPITYKARDGLQIEGYLTLPVDSAGKKLPTVMLPHGGPSGRDTEEFDYWSAFIASRGYAVLQVNFRGSGGYGESFANAKMQRWGLELQDDLTDGVEWLVKQGIADAKRVCIVGGSYGGYAALMGVVKTPDVFRCAVSFAGISDIQMVLDRSIHYTNSRLVRAQLGADRAQLKQTSPLRQVGKIKSPVLLIHGDEDRVVPVEHSDKMAGAMKTANKKVSYIRLEGGDHYLSLYRHRLAFLQELENFLAEHLK
jgi:dipeptidyl aminopeptidase/acylaminoacyl peptidase